MSGISGNLLMNFWEFGLYSDGALSGIKSISVRNQREFGQELLGILPFFRWSSVRNLKNLSGIIGNSVRNQREFCQELLRILRLSRGCSVRNQREFS